MPGCEPPRSGAAGRACDSARPSPALTAASRSFWLYCSTSTIGPTGSSGAPGLRSHGAGQGVYRRDSRGCELPHAALHPTGSPQHSAARGDPSAPTQPMKPSDLQQMKAGPLEQACL